MKKFNVYEKVDYYERLLKNTKDKTKENIYKNRLKSLKNSKEYTINGALVHSENKKFNYLKKQGWKPDPNWSGD